MILTLLPQTQTSLRGTCNHSNVTENVLRHTINGMINGIYPIYSESQRVGKMSFGIPVLAYCALQIGQANHIFSYLYNCILNNESISKPNNACITNAMKTVPRSEYNNDYGNHVSYQSKTSKCMKNHRHSLLCSRQVHHKLRDREPSRISMRRVFQLLKCRKLRKRHKNMLKKSTPVSSVLYNIATNYNYWKLKYFNSDNSFYSSFFRVPHKISVTYNAQKQTLLLSGDIELNPGPLTDNTIKAMCLYSNPDFTLRYRMLRHELTPLDVGGGGDCFFKSVSHELYGNSNNHAEIRALGVKYLKDNPERFIESIVGTSWSQYLTNMSLQGTWANHIIIQAVADAMNLNIHIIESDSNFREVTVVEPANATTNIRTIYIGHIGQMHHVSTCPIAHQQRSNDIDIEETVSNDSEKNKDANRNHNSDTSNSCTRKRDRAAYMRQYRQNNNSPYKKLKATEQQRKYRQMTTSPQKNQSVMSTKESIDK